MASPAHRSRVHGRVSCTICRQRKQRCELPPGTTHDPAGNLIPGLRNADTSCRRCQHLNLTCQVSPARLSRRSRPTASVPAELVGSPTPARSPSDVFPSSRQAPPIEPISHPTPTHATPLTTFEVSGEATDAGKERKRSTEYHGRPLSILCAMLNHLNTERGYPSSGHEESSELQDGAVLSHKPSWYHTLSVHSPYLPRLEDLHTGANKGDAAALFILHLSERLARVSPSKAWADENARLIEQSLRVLMFEAAETHLTRQALVFALVHLPTNIIPHQNMAHARLGLGHGALRLALALSSAAGDGEAAAAMVQTDSAGAWGSARLWAWLALCVMEAQMVLETSTIPRLDLQAFAARTVVSKLLDRPPMDLGDPASRDAKLSLCERILRLTAIHDAIQRFHQIVRDLCTRPGSSESVTGSVIETHMTCSEALAGATERCNRLQDPFQSGKSLSRKVDAVERAFEEGILHQRGMRTLFALRAVPFGPHTDPRLAHLAPPEVMDPFGHVEDRLGFALAAAVDPAAIARFFVDNEDAKLEDQAWRWAVARANAVDEMLCLLIEHFGDLGESAHEGLAGVPIHRLCGLAVDGTSVIIEQQAAAIVVGQTAAKIKISHRTTQRLIILRNAARVIRTLELDPGDPGGHSVASLAADAIEAMVRLARKRIERLESRDTPRETRASTSSESAVPQDSQAVFDAILDELFAGVV